MKKIIGIVIVLLCSSCNFENFEFLKSNQTNESVLLEQGTKDITSIEQLISLINDNILRDEYITNYKTNEEYDINDITKMLSYLLPFDIKVKKYKLDFNQNEYCIEVEFIDEDSKKCINKVKAIISNNINDGMNNEDKIKFVHNYIIEHCEYDERVVSRNDSNKEAFQISGVLFNKQAVCSGYSRSFLLFMRLLDIPCLYVPSDIINHSFNLVYDGNYKFIDTTWDESENRYYGLDIKAFFADGNHDMDLQYNRDYFMNFMARIYHLG